jgi:transposase
MVIKRDFRTLAPATQTELRRIAVAMVRAGKTRVEAAATVGVNRRFVGQWVKVAAQGGEAVLAGRRRGRRPGEQKALSAAQEEGLRYLIARGCPDQFGLSFALWTRQAVRALIARETGVWLTLPVVGRYLRAWGFTAQRPARRATERQDEAVRALPAKPRRTAVKSNGPTRPACPVGPITAAALPPEGTPRSSGDRASAFRSR